MGVKERGDLENILENHNITIKQSSAGPLGQIKEISIKTLPQHIKKLKTEKNYHLRISGRVKFDGIEKSTKVKIEYIGGVVRASGESVKRPATITEEFYIECVKTATKNEVDIYTKKNARTYLGPLITLLNHLVPSSSFHYH